MRTQGALSTNIMIEETEHDCAASPISTAPESMANVSSSINQTSERSKGSVGMHLAVCVSGIMTSYLIWGYIQENVMTKTYATGHFPSATFCVLSNRVCAIAVSVVVVWYRQGTIRIPAPMLAFAPSSITNSISSVAQYESLRYVSFLLQTLSKANKVIPVMLMGRILNKKTYPWKNYLEALLISVGVSVFSLSEHRADQNFNTTAPGVFLLALYVGCDSFTSQWQARVFKRHAEVDQFDMMFATNLWSIVLTLIALFASGEIWVTLAFLRLNPDAIMDNVIIAVTSAAGQLFIFYTIRVFGPVTLTLIMTTRQMLSMVLSASAFGHEFGFMAYVGAAIVFLTVFGGQVYRSSTKPKPPSAGGVSIGAEVLGKTASLSPTHLLSVCAHEPKQAEQEGEQKRLLGV